MGWDVKIQMTGPYEKYKEVSATTDDIATATRKVVDFIGSNCKSTYMATDCKQLTLGFWINVPRGTVIEAAVTTAMVVSDGLNDPEFSVSGLEVHEELKKP